MMLYSLLAVAFVFTIANRLYAKHTLNSLDTYAVTIVSNWIATILLVPFLISEFHLLGEMDLSQWLLIFLLGVLWTIIAWVINASIALNDFSFKEIIRQTRVLFVVLGGVLFLGETLTTTDVLGISSIVVAALLISFKRVSLKDHFTSKPVILAWVSSVLVAIATLMEKTLLTNTEPLLYAFFAFAIPSLFLLPLLTRARRSAVRVLLNVHRKQIALFSVLMVVTFSLSLFVYKLLPISIAYPLIQSATVFAIAIGTFIFEDGAHWKRKILAAVVAVIGILLIQVG